MLSEQHRHIKAKRRLTARSTAVFGSVLQVVAMPVAHHLVLQPPAPVLVIQIQLLLLLAPALGAVVDQVDSVEDGEVVEGNESHIATF